MTMSFDNYWKGLANKYAYAKSLEDLVRYKKRSLVVPAGLPFKVTAGVLRARDYNKYYF